MEKRTMTLTEIVFDGSNIADAIDKVCANKGAGGIDGKSTEDFKNEFKEGKVNFVKIREEVLNRSYIPSPIRRVYIPKENGDKRGLGIPIVKDRVMEQAIVQVLTPIYEKQFSETSFGFRPGRCPEMAITKILEYFNDGYYWVVDIDLEKFFDTVCHDILISIMETVKDGALVSLIRKYLTAGVMENGVKINTEVGTPQGGNLSPLLSNIMLNKLDKELEGRGLKFVRYADDCMILVKSEKAANRVMKSITRFIEKKLRLKVNISKSKVAKPEDIKYLGFGFSKDKEGIYRAKPHDKSIQKFVRKLKKITWRRYSISIAERIKSLNYVIRGWINYFKIADMKTAMKRIGQHIRRRIRMITWKQWKIPKKRIRRLIGLGIDKDEARALAYSRKGYWTCSQNPTINQAISNKLLEKMGLVFPLEHYEKVHI